MSEQPPNENTPKHAETIGLIRHEDVIQPFMLHNSIMRGRMVRLDHTLNTILNRHDYHELISRQLGELLALATMLSANLPEGGLLTLQLQSDGPIGFMVADAQADGGLRGYATANAESSALDALLSDETTGLPELMGKGYLAMTLDSPHGQPYQGIVPLSGASLAEAVGHYFSQSQQLDVMLNVHVSRRIREDGSTRWVAAGIMLERMPEPERDQPALNTKNHGITADDALTTQHTVETGEEGDDKPELSSWEYHSLLVRTATEEELSDPHLAPSALLYRLFNEGGVWVYDTSTVYACCRCSRQKYVDALYSLSAEELREIAEDGIITATCQFCNQSQSFTLAELDSQS